VHTGDSAAGKNARTAFFPLKSLSFTGFMSGSGNSKSGAESPIFGTEERDVLDISEIAAIS
jgi:hypothetical protein